MCARETETLMRTLVPRWAGGVYGLLVGALSTVNV